MKLVSRRVRWIFDNLYADRAKERSYHLTSYAHSFLETLDFDVDGYHVDEGRIIRAVDSYFLDVIRYKEYHFDGASSLNIFSEEWARSVHHSKRFTGSFRSLREPLFTPARYNPSEPRRRCHYVRR